MGDFIRDWKDLYESYRRHAVSEFLKNILESVNTDKGRSRKVSTDFGGDDARLNGVLSVLESASGGPRGIEKRLTTSAEDERKYQASLRSFKRNYGFPIEINYMEPNVCHNFNHMTATVAMVIPDIRAEQLAKLIGGRSIRPGKIPEDSDTFNIDENSFYSGIVDGNRIAIYNPMSAAEENKAYIEMESPPALNDFMLAHGQKILDHYKLMRGGKEYFDRLEKTFHP
jgi:hypothetical protein